MKSRLFSLGFGFGILLLTALPITCLAQSTVRGIVTERDTGQPLQGATITLRLMGTDDSRGTTSDQNGFYRFGNVSQGRYEILVSYIGFTTFRDTVTTESGGEFTLKNIELTVSSEQLGEITVSDQGGALEAGQINIRPERFGRSPAPAGTADLAGYIQSQPGVLATGDRGGQLFVRGGLPSENLILMDGTLVYQPFHIVGFFSVFPEDVVASADFFAGGFSGRYSGRASSVMDVRLKNGNLYTPGWSASLSPFISDLYVETPVKKGESSLMVSIRGSLIEQSSQVYLADEQPLKFNSQLAKYVNTSGSGVNCSAMALRTYDRGLLDNQSEQYFKWNNLAAGGRCAGTSEGSSISFTEVNFGLSYFSNETGGGGTSKRFSNIFRSNLDIHFVQQWGERQLEYGFFTNYRTVSYDLADRFASLNSDEETFLSTGGYLMIEIPIGDRISFTPGFLATSYMNRISSTIEPRVRFSIDIPGIPDSEIHGAAGVYRQPLIGLSDFRDAGTAFTAWMLPPESDRSLQTKHFLLGWRSRIGRFLEFSAEGYHKQIEDSPVSLWSTVAEFTTNLAYADGTVDGFDLRLSAESGKFYGSVGYGYSIIEYSTVQNRLINGLGETLQTYNPSHDRRHQLNARTGLEMDNFSVNINWSYGSGMPFTRPIGFDSFFSFENGLPNVTENYGTPRILLEKPFQGRLPVYHRLDISMEKRFSLSAVDMRIQLGAINVYNQSNLFYYDVYFQRGINQLPIVPYMSVKMGSR